MFPLTDLTRIVATYELPEITTPDDAVWGSLRFVVQILRLPTGAYVPRVLRKERFNLAPAYYQKKPGLLEQATVEVLDLETSRDWESFECDSERDAVQRALDELQRLLGR